MSRGQGPLYEEGVDLDVVDVGDGECPRAGAQHDDVTRPLRCNYRSARSMVATSVSLRTESRMSSPAMPVHFSIFLPVYLSPQGLTPERER